MAVGWGKRLWWVRARLWWRGSVRGARVGVRGRWWRRRAGALDRSEEFFFLPYWPIDGRTSAGAGAANRYNLFHIIGNIFFRIRPLKFNSIHMIYQIYWRQSMITWYCLNYNSRPSTIWIDINITISILANCSFFFQSAIFNQHNIIHVIFTISIHN